MLVNILDTTMKKAEEFEKYTKATKFGNSYKRISKQPDYNNEEDLMLKKISYYSKAGKTAYPKDELSDFITERNDQKEQILNFENTQKTGLPFFRSIEYKLTKGIR